MTLTPEEFAALAPIHPDSLPDYKRWEMMLRRWNARINLVASNSLPDFWNRHALDSAQILPHIPDTARIVVDFGSGAGFPGLAIAIEAKHRKLIRTVHMIESAGKKASFLKSVSRETLLPVDVHAARIEKLPMLNADIITARAFAPLNRLLPLAWEHLSETGELLLLKGEAVHEEIEEAHIRWTFESKIFPSLSADNGHILRISDLQPR